MSVRRRRVTSQLYTFQIDDERYTVEGWRYSDSTTYEVTLHLGYPRVRELGKAIVDRDSRETVQEVVVRGGHKILKEMK
jgi:hypothetical protein